MYNPTSSILIKFDSYAIINHDNRQKRSVDVLLTYVRRLCRLGCIGVSKYSYSEMYACMEIVTN